MVVDPAIAEAIIEAVKAGTFWKAARLNLRNRSTWEEFAAIHHDRAANLLVEAVGQVSPNNAGTRKRMRPDGKHS